MFVAAQMCGDKSLFLRRRSELQHIAALAADLTGCAVAIVCSLDGGQMRSQVVFGIEPQHLAPLESWCAIVKHAAAALVVPDIQANTAFTDPAPNSPNLKPRFFAGVPVTSAAGEVLAVLAVLDPTPRPAASVETDSALLTRLQRLASLASTLLDITTQRDQFRVELSEAALLRDIHAALADQASVPGALETILRGIMEVTQATYAQVWELREDAWMAQQLAFTIRNPADEARFSFLRTVEAVPLRHLAIADLFQGNRQMSCHLLTADSTAPERVRRVTDQGISCLISSALLESPRRFAMVLGLSARPHDVEWQLAQVGRLSEATRPILLRKLANERVHLLGSALSATNDGVILFKTSHPPGSLRLAYVNRAFTKMTQHERADILGASPFVLPSPQADPAEVAGFRQAVINGVQHSAVLLIQRRDRSSFWAEVTLVPLPPTGEHDDYFVAVLRDVTQIRTDAEAQRERERELRATAEALHLRTEQLSRAQHIARLGTWRWQVGSPTVEWSDSVYQMAGVRLGDFIPAMDTILPLIHPDDRNAYRNRLADWQRDGVGEAMEFRLQMADSTVRHLWSDFSCEIDSTGQVLAISGIVQDVTERKEAEAMLLHAEKLRSIGQLTGGIAHDFNNLLTVISINLEMIGLLLGPQHPAEEMRAMAAKATRNGADLTSNLLAFARRQPLNPVSVDVAELLQSLRKLASPSLGERHLIDISVEANLPRCLVDRSGLEGALLNLLVNSRDAMPQGGLIALHAVSLPPGHRSAAVAKLKPGRYISIAVVDSGVGIPSHLQEMVFEPFFTTKPAGKGTGLGLSSVIGFIRQSGGDVELQSVEGQGTTLRLLLPACAAV